MDNVFQYLPIIVFPVAWCFAFFLSAELSGWSELAQKYACKKPYDGPKRGWQWGKFGWVSYKSCLWIAITAEGLYIETGPGFIFRPFHPPLLIPWSAVKSVEQTKYWFFSVLLMRFNDSGVKLTIESSFLADLKPHLGSKIRDKSPNLIED